MSCVADSTMGDALSRLRASLEAERLRAERAEGKVEGFREAFALLAGRFAAPAAEPLPETAPSPAPTSAPVLRLAQAPSERDGARDAQRDGVTLGVTGSVTGPTPEQRRKAQNRERARAYRLRQASVTASVTGPTPEQHRKAQNRERARAYRLRQASVTASVTQEEEEEVITTPPPSSSRVTASVTDEKPVRGTLALVATAARESREAKPPPKLPPEVQALREAWDSLCGTKSFIPWPARTSARLLEDAQAALARRPLEEWRRVFALVPRSPVCRGELSSGRRASLLWLLAGKTRDNYEPAEKLLAGDWSVDPEDAGAPPAVEAPPPAAGSDTPAGQAWSEVLAALRAEGKHYALQWLEQLRARSVDEGHLVLEARDSFARGWMAEHYGELLARCVGVLGLAGVRYVLPGEVGP
ncbi:DnaA N-terminal domain-containing protein [Archangium primigenium]|uniref:DnaA N-terminal domain-containing protein n=1 Tax=[Archangium] primigenium TaxID=2792470 RepID=UPI0019566496|nr:DnaA N-terminal domain-containing protein [Archangium primigenium]MBM7117613.1 hypothetical protein [Archangium primigenium]